LNCYIDSYIFFHSDLSGRWLWNLEGLYASVLETDQEVPYQIGAQGSECRVLCVSHLIKINYNIVYNNIVRLFRMLLCPPISHRQDPHFLARIMHLLREARVLIHVLIHHQSQSQHHPSHLNRRRCA